MLFGKVFIVLQNVITIVMLGVSLTMILQCKHLINAPLGYDTSNLMSIRNPEYTYSSDTVENRHLDNFISMIRSQALVRMVSACNGTPLDYGSNYFCTIKGKSTPIQRFYGDSSYFKILNLGLKADYDNFDENGYFINSQAIADYGIKPSDRIFHPFGDDQPDVAPIRGILNDFIIGDITAEQRPVILQIQKNYKFPYIVLIKYSGNPIDAYNVVSKAYSESFHSDFVSDQPRPFVDSQVRHHFKTQLKLSHIVSMFTFVAILISLLGLIAMSTYYIQQRSKEIAVRKVFGSTGKQVTAKLVRSFLMYVAIAFVIAVPIIWYFMGNWLTNYSYRIKLSPWIFIAAGAFTLLISFLAVLSQSLKAANADPIDDIVEKE